MPTCHQLLKDIRRKKKHYNWARALEKCPHKRGICIRVYNCKPKKPNSAQRKIAKVRLSTGRKVIVYVPGQGHNLHEYSAVLIRGGRVPDRPGVHYHAVRGKYDFTGPEHFGRRQRRSKFSRKIFGATPRWMRKRTRQA